MIELPPDFSAFLNLLIKNKVRFLLVGGYAVGIYGHVRATNDVGIWIEATPENATRTERAIKEFGFDVPELTSSMLIRPGKVTRMGHPPIRIEILNRISGVEFEDAYEARLSTEISGITVPVIGRSDLIKNKLSAGRYKDLADAEELRKLD